MDTCAQLSAGMLSTLVDLQVLRCTSLHDPQPPALPRCLQAAFLAPRLWSAPPRQVHPETFSADPPHSSTRCSWLETEGWPFREGKGRSDPGGTKGPRALPWEIVACSDLLVQLQVPGRPGGVGGAGH